MPVVIPTKTIPRKAKLLVPRKARLLVPRKTKLLKIRNLSNEDLGSMTESDWREFARHLKEAPPEVWHDRHPHLTGYMGVA